MTMLKPNKKEKMEVKGKMKKSLILGLAAGLILSFATTAMAAVTVSGGKDTAFAANDPQKVDTMDFDTVVGNNYADPAAHSGFYLPGNPSDGTTKIHSNYTKNTDACAACHFTHTAEGARLLQWDSIYKTCSACHDGSLGDYTYDVYSGYIGTAATGTNAGKDRAFGGLFGSSVNDMLSANEGGATAVNSLSNHMPNGYMALNAAPGNTLNNTYFAGVAFDCASCHTPHGQGGNARILSPDPGKVAISKFFTDDKTTNKDAALAVLAKTLNPSTDYKVWTENANQNMNWIQGYPYNKVTAFFVVDSNASVTYSFDNTKVPAVVAKVGGVEVAPVTPDIINYRKGEVSFTNAVASDKKVIAVRVPGIFVAMKITNYMQDTEKVEYVAKNVKAYSSTQKVDGASDANEGINAYCGACHGDYNTQGKVANKDYDFVTSGDVNHGSGQMLTGIESSKYRHQFGFKWNKQWTGQANYIKFAYPIKQFNTSTKDVELDYDTPIFTCLGCHFAHGTDEGLWNNYSNGAITGGETYGSSALKRLPNMGTCENCHDKGAGNNKDENTVSGAVYRYY